MITPPFLQPGDRVGIVATARRISRSEVEPAIALLSSWGLVVESAPNLFEIEHQFAGSDEMRAADFQLMLDNQQIKAIFCARGGYGTVRIIDMLNFSQFEKHPKWIIGYSDITVLHSHIHRHCNIETLHATMPVNFPQAGGEFQPVNALKNCLFGETPSYSINAGALSRNGHGKGIVTGGNLSILYSLSGTTSDIDTDGKILFIEDLDEYLYHVDRMMMNLKRSGKLENLAGLIVGGMTEMRDNSIPFGKSAEQIIAEAVRNYKYPVLFGFPAGHLQQNMPLVMGREAVLDVAQQAGVVFMPAQDMANGKHLKKLIKPGIFFLGFFALLYFLIALLTGNL
ncbi:MAG: LD-carboxypeptidase [Lentimicrobiaceae bacterium]|nr:LD-carboxypeptidase [Lentimicrobiaceae bacterium]